MQTKSEPVGVDLEEQPASGWHVDPAAGLGPPSISGQFDQISPTFRRLSNAAQVFTKTRAAYEAAIKAGVKKCASFPRLEALRKQGSAADRDLQKAARELADVQKRKELLLQDPPGQGFGIQLQKLDVEIGKLENVRDLARKVVDGLRPATEAAEADFWSEMISQVQGIAERMRREISEARQRAMEQLAQLASPALDAIQNGETAMRSLAGLTSDPVSFVERVLGERFRRKPQPAPPPGPTILPRAPGVYPTPPIDDRRAPGVYPAR